MKFSFLIIILIVCQFKAFTQTNGYYFSSQIDSILKTDATPYKFQTAAVYYSYIGEYEKALTVRDNEFNNFRASSPNKSDSALFSIFSKKNAKNVILEEAAKTNIIIINEAHHQPQHRSFVTSLLKDLKNIGYAYIGFETLNYSDSLINQRKYPILTSGYYSIEPCFGNLIREAISNNIEVFGYEKNYLDNNQKIIDREQAQALNIKRVLDKNPNAKIIIYCGYDHAIEDSTRNFMVLPMAGHLKRITGINPFTIDQTKLTEYSKVGSNFRKLINQKKDCIFTDSFGNYFNKASSPKSIDCNIYHPNTKFIKGRPNWQLQSSFKLINLTKRIKIDYPCLVKIYLTTDNDSLAVPIDIIEMKGNKDKKHSLVYKHKKQFALATNLRGEKQKFIVK